MSIVTLVSGGLDSTVMAVMAAEEGLRQQPVFVDYGHRAARAEWAACKLVLRKQKLPPPLRINMSGFGAAVPSGLTNSSMDVLADAFLPCRNLLFLLAGAAVASRRGASSVAIGLLNEKNRLFADQSKQFLSSAQSILRTATATSISIVAPLMDLEKASILELAKRRGITGTYSCHSGTRRPCGRCISCREIFGALGGETHGRQ